MDDKVDALVRAFASDDDAVVVVADEGGVAPRSTWSRGPSHVSPG